MSLSIRDSVKVKAALAELRHLGHDPAEVSDLAGRMVRMGTPVRQAYDTAFNKFVARVPSAHAPIQRIGQLIEATDTRTIARYNVALDNYITSGDPEALRSVAPTIKADMQAMAVRTGDAGFADGLTNAAQIAAPQPEQGTAPPRPGHGPEGFRPQEARAAQSGDTSAAVA